MTAGLGSRGSVFATHAARPAPDECFCLDSIHVKWPPMRHADLSPRPTRPERTAYELPTVDGSRPGRSREVSGHDEEVEPEPWRAR